MAIEHTQAHPMPSWFLAPGDTDTYAWVAIGFLCLGVYGLVTLYAAFDRWAEHQSKGTPLAKTIPTLLTIALVYEVFPVGHFNVLLPISAILLALMADWSRFNLRKSENNDSAAPSEAPVSGTETAGSDIPEAKNV